MLHRIRAHAILLSDTEFKLTELARIYNICRQTAATWLHAWKDSGISALFDKTRSGRPHIFATKQKLMRLYVSINRQNH